MEQLPTPETQLQDAIRQLDRANQARVSLEMENERLKRRIERLEGFGEGMESAFRECLARLESK
jgi:hypothetical protein